MRYQGRSTFVKRKNIFGQEVEIPEKPSKPTPAQMQRLEQQKWDQERKERETTDIEEWLTKSGPMNLEEMATFRDELKRQRGAPVAPFSKSVSQSYDGTKDIWKITGHTKTLVLTSDKARNYFRKRLKLWEGTLTRYQELGIILPSRTPPEPKRRRSLIDMSNEHKAKKQQE